jgi:hypothetical protein
MHENCFAVYIYFVEFCDKIEAHLKVIFISHNDIEIYPPVASILLKNTTK